VFSPAETVACAGIPIKNDVIPEPNEFFSIRFVPQPGQVGIVQTNLRDARVTILDDDGESTSL